MVSSFIFELFAPVFPGGTRFFRCKYHLNIINNEKEVDKNDDKAVSIMELYEHTK